MNRAKSAMKKEDMGALFVEKTAFILRVGETRRRLMFSASRMI
jgi:hypothetical protein